MKHSELGQGLNPLLHRDCPKCEARMRLALIEPEPFGQEKLVFDCTWCRHGEVVVLDLNSAVRHANGCSSPKQATFPAGHRPGAGNAWVREHFRRLGQAPRF